MEVQLDLSLGFNHPDIGFETKEVLGLNPSTTGFEPKEVLNYSVIGFKRKEVLGLNINTGFESKNVLNCSVIGLKRKKVLGSNLWSFGCIDTNYKLKDYHSSQTLPLLPWSSEDQPNEEDEHPKKKPPSCPLNMNDGGATEEEDEVVGWPPIKSWRKKVLHHHQQGGHIIGKNRARGRARELGNDKKKKEKNNIGGSNSNNMYVKVKMEGVAIARKINLSHFHSYQTLTQFLINMFFPKCQDGVEEEEKGIYTLTYQDKDGDWLLAGDVPWQTFIESVQRLELQRNGG